MSILESMNIGSNALKAHGLRLDIHAKNIANIDTPNYVRRIPVLIFSSLIDEAMFRKCKTVQANGAFSKPELGQVIDFIHNAIEEEKKKYC